MKKPPQQPEPASQADASWPSDAVEVGHVVGAWGVKGGVKIAPESSDATSLLATKRWWLRPKTIGRINHSSSISYEVLSKRVQGDGVMAMLAGIDDRDQAQALVGATIYVPRSAFPKAGKGEFYWVDLIGCEVFNREGLALGRVDGLIDTGVHSVLRVVDASAVEPTERLIPFVDAYVDKTDLKTRRIDVDWGLDY